MSGLVTVKCGCEGRPLGGLSWWKKRDRRILRFFLPILILLKTKVQIGTGDYGIYLTGDKEIAKSYLKGHKKADRELYEVYVRIENPYKTNDFIALNIRQYFDKTILNPQKNNKREYK